MRNLPYTQTSSQARVLFTCSLLNVRQRLVRGWEVVRSLAQVNSFAPSSYMSEQRHAEAARGADLRHRCYLPSVHVPGIGCSENAGRTTDAASWGVAGLYRSRLCAGGRSLLGPQVTQKNNEFGDHCWCAKPFPFFIVVISSMHTIPIAILIVLGYQKAPPSFLVILQPRRREHAPSHPKTIWSSSSPGKTIAENF